MLPRRYSHPKYIQWGKKILVMLAFLFPVYMFLNSNFLVDIILQSFMMIVVILVGIYYFGQDIWEDQDGLEVEFLRKKIRVRRVDIIDIETIWGSIGKEKNIPLIVLVDGLTPFHRLFGVLYGLSIKPGFIIFPSISDFQGLRETIQHHLRK